jgi:20S proteasome subunit alpha 3
MEAISHAGTALGILATDGIILAAEKQTTSKLLDQQNQRSSEKIYLLSDHIAAAVAGITSDANTLINYCRQAAQSHLITYGENIPCEQLAQKLCDLKQGYTQYGGILLVLALWFISLGLRPFGVSFLYAGWDQHSGFQLYHSDPSGNYFGWKAHCIGSNNASAQSILKQDYKEDMNLEDICGLAVKILSKTMETSNLTSEKLEFVKVYMDENNQVVFHMLGRKEIDELLEKYKPEETTPSATA